MPRAAARCANPIGASVKSRRNALVRLSQPQYAALERLQKHGCSRRNRHGGLSISVVLLCVLFPGRRWPVPNFPDWAYPVPPQGLPRPDPNKIVKVPGSDKTYNEAQVNNPFGPPDWFPSDHPPMPKAVARAASRSCAPARSAI